jgi:hypothetical protein
MTISKPINSSSTLIMVDELLVTITRLNPTILQSSLPIKRNMLPLNTTLMSNLKIMNPLKIMGIPEN